MPSEGLTDDLSVREATVEDADALATLFLAARDAAFPAIPRGVHPPDDVRRWMRTHFDAEGTEVWLAEEDGHPVAVMILEHDWLHSLYVDPARTGQGIGALLLDVAKTRRPQIGLWVFESNEGAQRFYRRHGFVEVRRTDGRDNEEQAPDIELAWPDPGSLVGLRSRIDDLDDRLARVLADRAALTARIQRLKEVPGHAGRDRRREEEIVLRMARAAPGLGVDGLRRIMDAVISASLDAARSSDRAGEEPGDPA